MGSSRRLKAKTTMFTTQSSKTYFSARPLRMRRGQSIVVALLVLLLLGLVGALFVTVVARNLINAGKGNRIQTADSYARAGITYADAQLSSSADGADWRPPLQFAVLDGTNGNPDYRPGTGPAGPAYPNGSMVSTGDSRERKRYKSQVYDPLNNPTGILKPVATGASGDPDTEYLRAGFARYNTGAGRYLVRVTYDPVNVATASVSPGKYLKIESIGREGTIDPNDPTTFINNRSTDKTQATLVALKPIGITDYARFETNPDKRSDIANLGVVSQFYAANTDGGIATPGVFDFNSGSSSPVTLQEYPVVTTYGAADAFLKTTATPSMAYPNPTSGTGMAAPSGYTLAAGGGSIHSNMPLRFFGTNIVYLNDAGANAPLFQDTLEIGGDLLLDGYDQNAKLNNSTLDANGQGQQAALILNPTNTADLIGKTSPDKSTYIAPSNSNAGTNGTFNTQGGLVRDGSMQNDPAGLPRSITRLEPPVMDAQDTATQIPRYRAIAINSAPRPNLMLNGSGYTPPTNKNPSLYGYGKSIYINNPSDVQPDSASIGGGSTLTDEWLHRTSANSTDPSKGGWNGLFYNPPGVSIVLGQEVAPPATAGAAGTYGIRFIRNSGDTFANPDGTASSMTQMDVKYSDLDTDPTGAASDNNIIIYLEGNVRLRGILSPNEGTGNTSTTQKFIPRHITIVTNGTAYIEGNLLKGTPDSSISVLAHDYVCINTTQFLAGANVEEHNDGTQNPDLPKSRDLLSLDEGHSLLQEFNFGLTGNTAPAKYGSLALYIAAGPESPGSAKADLDIFNLTTNTGLVPAPVLTFDTFRRTTVDLSAFPSLTGALATDLFQLSVRKDNGQEDGNGVSTTSGQNVSLERVAVLPMDIRIEAVLYAQTRSFFVIPGEWFNTNGADTLDVYQNGANSSQGASRPFTDSRFPLYGQPIDLKITISGSVSEAHPADIAAQTAWMSKWGWIPQYHGTPVVTGPAGSQTVTTEPAGHGPLGQPAIGLQIIYDPQAGYPYDPAPVAAPTAPYYLRSDQFGRPLAFTPKLPVSAGLLYAGQSGDAPLLQ